MKTRTPKRPGYQLRVLATWQQEFAWHQAAAEKKGRKTRALKIAMLCAGNATMNAAAELRWVQRLACVTP